MTYIALYRKYRPKTFADIIGQDHITSTLINQIKLSKISHAYLFSGIRGTGKTSAAKVFAKAINCCSPVNFEPCGTCQSCMAQQADSMPDILEIDAASNRGIDEIRQIRESVKYRPVMGKYKVYIIDEAHMLTGEAFNALLKTLEEPPEYAVFILATTEPHKLPLTIVSRTQRYDFKRLSNQDVQNHLINICAKENINITQKAAFNIALLSEGAMRDALSLLDKCSTYASEATITEDIVNFIAGRADDDAVLAITENMFCADIDNMLSTLSAQAGSGKDILTILDSIISFIREIIICKYSEDAQNVIMRSERIIKNMKDLSSKIALKQLIKALDVLIEAQNRIAFAHTPVYVLECALLQIAAGVKPDNTQYVSPAAAAVKELQPLPKEAKPTPAAPKSEMSAVEAKPQHAKQQQAKTQQPAQISEIKNDEPKSKPLPGSKELKEKLQIKVYEKYPFTAMGIDKTDVIIKNDSIDMLAPENVYSMINEKKEIKDYISKTAREIINKKDIAVNIIIKKDIKKQAIEAFGDILKFEE